MAYNFLRGDRDQPFLLPPDLRDWLPDGHLAWFILDVVDQVDLAPFYLAHRDDGHGHPAYDPKLLLGVLLYAYCVGVRSSRQIERRLTEDLAFRVLAANQLPDHVTVARFRVRHQHALAGFLVESLRLCVAAGMVRLGMVALDGTKVAANAATTASHTLDKLKREVAEILRQAAEADQREDLEHRDARGDELPAALASKAGRLTRLRQAKAQLEAEAAERQRRYEQRVAALAAAARAKGKQPRAHIKPRRRDEAPNPKATANVTDPDSRFMHTRRGTIQGYNAQAVTTLEQVIVAAELTQDANDLQQLDPMLEATAATLAAAGIPGRPGKLLADSGYWSIANLTQIPEAARPPGQAPQGRQADRVQKRWAARRDDGEAGQRGRQGVLRQAQGNHRAGLRSDQRAAGGAAVPAPGACRLRRRVEAAVRHPQPAQVVAAPDHTSIGQPGDHLSRHSGGNPATAASVVYPPGTAATTLPRPARPLPTHPRRLWATGSMEYRTRGLMLARLGRRPVAVALEDARVCGAANQGPRGNVPNETDEVGTARAGPAGHQNPPVSKPQRR
jgi:transposase